MHRHDGTRLSGEARFPVGSAFQYFYHRHPILIEPDEKRKQFLLATVAVVRRELIRALSVMGITVPPVM